jgi:hypothetical protein
VPSLDGVEEHPGTHRGGSPPFALLGAGFGSRGMSRANAGPLFRGAKRLGPRSAPVRPWHPGTPLLVGLVPGGHRMGRPIPPMGAAPAGCSGMGPPSPSYPSWVWRTQVGLHRFREAPQPGVAFLAPGPENPAVLALSSRTAGRGLGGRPALFPPSLVGTLRGTAWDDPLRPTTSARWLLGLAVAAWLSRGPRCDCMHFATGDP